MIDSILKSRFRFKKNAHSRKSGLPPGTPVYTGTKHDIDISVQVIKYNDEIFSEQEFGLHDEFLFASEQNTVIWTNINGLHDDKIIANIGDFYNLHHLLQEDILNVFQIPKVEEYTENDIIFITLHEFYFDEQEMLRRDQISLVVGDNFLLSFQEEEGDYFENIRDRIRNKKGKICKKGSDYLLYVLIDAIVDSYFLILDQFTHSMEMIDEKIYTHKTKNHLSQMYAINKDLIYLRRSIAPLREVVIKLMKEDTHQITPDLKPFLRDLNDHLNQLVNEIDSDKEYLTGLVQTNMANLNSHMNEIIKVLTMISAIFIPLTFIVGVYGMNFEFLPELSWQYGYGAVWLIMLLITIVQIIIYKKKKWL